MFTFIILTEWWMIQTAVQIITANATAKLALIPGARFHKYEVTLLAVNEFIAQKCLTDKLLEQILSHGTTCQQFASNVLYIVRFKYISALASDQSHSIIFDK